MSFGSFIGVDLVKRHTIVVRFAGGFAPAGDPDARRDKARDALHGIMAKRYGVDAERPHYTT
jgi:hypothetical protein